MNRKIIDGVEHKKCGWCNRWRPLTLFYKRKSLEGYRKECKACFSKQGKSRYIRDKDIILQRNKKYVDSHKEDVNKYKSEWQKQNSERRRIRLNERYKSEPNFRIAVNLRSRILKALDNNQRYGSTLELLGCSVDEFREYLSSQFVEGMSWNNHGIVWHIDHIKPCSKFDLSDENQQRTCFHYTNMQPLFAEDNLSKGSKIL